MATHTKKSVEKVTSIASTIRSMKKTVAYRSQAFAGGRERQPALRAYGDPLALLAALEASSSMSSEARGAVVAALVSEHQRTGGELWQTLAVVAFEPALLRIRKCLKNPGSVDSDQRVFLSFLEALASSSVANAGAFAPVALIRATKKALFEKVRLERATRQELELFDDDRHEDAERPRDELQSRLDLARSGAILDALEPEVKDVLVATVGGEESLKDYVARCLPGASDSDRAAHYERLRTQRANAVARMRAADAA